MYNILLSDIPPPPEGDLLLIYADDILVASSGPRMSTVNRRLNGYLSSLDEYFRKWGIKLNAAKSNGIIFKGSGLNLYPNARKFTPKLKIGTSEIKCSSSMKYLGVVFNERFNFIGHIDHVLQKSKKTFFAYHKVISRHNGLSKQVRLLIYRQIVRPTLAYAFPVWFAISSHQMERLRIWERRILSTCLGLKTVIHNDGTMRRPSCKEIYNSVDFGRIDTFLVNSGLKFLENCKNLDNDLVKACFSTSDADSVTERKSLGPLDLLFLHERDLLETDGKLLFYHRRFNTLDIDNVVYNIMQ